MQSDYLLEAQFRKKESQHSRFNGIRNALSGITEHIITLCSEERSFFQLEYAFFGYCWKSVVSILYHPVSPWLYPSLLQTLDAAPL